MMLSRVADHLYWLSRYLERAEHTARLVDVTLDLASDRSAGARKRAWEKLCAGLRLPAPADGLRAYELTQWLTFDASNEGSIVFNIAAARENARQVREQISSEMWEQINRLYLDVKTGKIDQIWQSQPHEFFQMVKQGAHLFQGISDSTMNHGEGWHFIQVGQFIERVSNVAALLHVYLKDMPVEPQSTLSADQYLDWVGLLRSCTAFESYCKVYTADLQYHHIVEFLLLDEEFPHSIHFSIKMMRAALNVIAEATDTRKNSQVYRQIGRLKAMLDFDQIDEIIADGLQAYLNNIQRQCSQIHGTIYQTYVSYPINEKLAA
jgi:uncharacterized alpha-E superfamily protein